MKVLHITPSSNGYEIVKLLANRYSRKNQLAVIENEQVGHSFTGGLLFNNTERIRKLFDSIPKNELYDFARELKEMPFEKAYYTED